jgi:hypothetical protein
LYACIKDAKPRPNPGRRHQRHGGGHGHVGEDDLSLGQAPESHRRLAVADFEPGGFIPHRDEAADPDALSVFDDTSEHQVQSGDAAAHDPVFRAVEDIAITVADSGCGHLGGGTPRPGLGDAYRRLVSGEHETGRQLSLLVGAVRHDRSDGAHVGLDHDPRGHAACPGELLDHQDGIEIARSPTSQTLGNRHAHEARIHELFNRGPGYSSVRSISAARGGGILVGEPTGRRLQRLLLVSQRPHVIGHLRSRLRLTIGRSATIGNDLPVAQLEHPVGDIDQGRIVRGDDGRDILTDHEGVDQVHDHAPGMGVELAGWFVGQQEPGPIGQSTGDSDPLLLAARQFVRAVTTALAEPDEVEQNARPFVALGNSRLGEPQRDLHVLGRSQDGNQPESLEDESDLVASDVDQAGFVHLGYVIPGEQNSSRRRPVEPTDDVEERGLPAPGAAVHGNQRTRGHSQIDVSQRNHGVGTERVLPGDALRFDNRIPGDDPAAGSCGPEHEVPVGHHFGPSSLPPVRSGQTLM